LLSRKQGNNRAKMCDRWGGSGHTTATDAAHTLKSLDLAAVVADSSLCRQPTAAERQFLRLPPIDSARGRGRGKGKGSARGGRVAGGAGAKGVARGARGRGRGRGRVRFGRPLELTAQGEN